MSAGFFLSGLVKGFSDARAAELDRKQKERETKLQTQLYELNLKNAQRADELAQRQVAGMEQIQAEMRGGQIVQPPGKMESLDSVFASREPAINDDIWPTPTEPRSLSDIMSDMSMLPHLVNAGVIDDLVKMSEAQTAQKAQELQGTLLKQFLGGGGSGGGSGGVSGGVSGWGESMTPGINIGADGLSLTLNPNELDELVSVTDLANFRDKDGNMPPLTTTRRQLASGLADGSITSITQSGVGEATATALAQEISIHQSLNELQGAAESNPEYFGQLNSMFKKVGNKWGKYLPVAVIEHVKETWGIDLTPDPQAAVLYAKIAGITNLVSSLRSGKTLTQDEIKRLGRELPSETDMPDKFIGKLNAYSDALERQLRTKLDVLKLSGKDVEGLNMLFGEERTQQLLDDIETVQAGGVVTHPDNVAPEGNDLTQVPIFTQEQIDAMDVDELTEAAKVADAQTLNLIMQRLSP